MNIAQKIRALWSSSKDLNAVLPTERLTTGVSVQKELPVGVILENETELLSMTNLGPKTRFVRAQVELSVESHDAVEVLQNETPKIFGAENHFQILAFKTVCDAADSWKIVLTLSSWEEL